MNQVPVYGVSLAFIHKFFANYYVDFDLKNMSTTQVTDSIVVEKTKDCERSFCDYVRYYTMGEEAVKWEDCNRDPDRYFGKATVFVSHIWANSYIELVEALEAWLAKTDRNGTAEEYFWVDNFIINQHEKEQSFDWWANTFKQSLADIGRAVMVMHPWNAPVYTTRAWCLFELFSLVDLNVRHTRSYCLPPRIPG